MNPGHVCCKKGDRCVVVEESDGLAEQLQYEWVMHLWGLNWQGMDVHLTIAFFIVQVKT